MTQKYVQRIRGITAASFLALVMASSPAHSAAIEDIVDPNFYGAPIRYTADGKAALGYSYVWSVTNGFVDFSTIPDFVNYWPSLEGVDGTGSVFVGYASDGINTQAIRMTQSGGIQFLGLISNGDTASYASAISRDGSTIVGQGVHAGFIREAFRWTASGGMEGLGLVGGGNYTGAKAVNADGTVVVGEGTDSSFDFIAWRWTEDNGMQDLGTIAGGTNYRYSTASAVSDDGNVVAGTAYHDDTSERTFRWTQGTGMVDIGLLAGSTYSDFHQMTTDGSGIIGNTTIGGDARSFRWTDANGLEDLGVLTEYIPNYNTANFVSADGSTIIGKSDNPILNNDDMMRWTQATGIENLGPLQAPSWSDGEVRGISDDASVVVGFFNDDYYSNAFRYTELGGIELLTLFPGGAYSSAAAVSGDGTVIVGEADDASGYIRAFRWTQGGGTEDLGTLPGDLYSSAYLVSDDGSVIAGSSSSGAPFYTSQAMRWTQGGGMEGLGFLAGGTGSTASAISGDGSTIVGYADMPGYSQVAFRWTQGGGMEDLGVLAAGTYSYGSFVSSDGSAIAGPADDAIGATVFHWTQGTGMVGLGYLNGGNYTEARGLSDDGSVIVGGAYDSVGDVQAFRWEVGDTSITGLGFITGGNYSLAKAVNQNGSVVVGEANDSNGIVQAFRWTQSSGMVGLGYFNSTVSGNSSQARGLNADASMIVGTATNNSGTPTAFLWTEDDGMQSLSAVLQGLGVNMTGWSLEAGNSISEDGVIIFGEGTNGGNASVFMANLASGGLTTPEDLAESLNTATLTSQQATSLGVMNLSQSLFAARNISTMAVPISFAQDAFIPYGGSVDSFAYLEPAAGGEITRNLRPSRFSLYTTGSYGVGQNNNSSNNGLDGTIGINMKVTDNLNIGVGVIGGVSTNEMPFGGESEVDSLGGSTILSYENDAGLRLYGAAFVSRINADIDRAYMNGGSIDHSSGSTEGLAYGGAAQVGWEFKISREVGLMPFNEWRWSETSMDAYEETGGAFPARFTDQNSDSLTSRLGLQLNYQQSDVLKWNFRAAWGHRFDDGGARFTATSSGLTQSIGGQAGDSDWAEGAIGLGWQVSDRVRLNTEISGRTGDTAEPQMGVLFGASVAF